MIGDDELVAEYLKTNTVTRCPTAMLLETTATISDEDRDAHIARGLDPVGDAWRAKRAKDGQGWAKYWELKKGRTNNGAVQRQGR